MNCELHVEVRGVTSIPRGVTNLQANGLLVLASCRRLELGEQRHAGVDLCGWVQVVIVGVGVCLGTLQLC